MRRSLLALLIPLALLAVPAGAVAKNPWLKSRPLNIAHQGGEDEFPSNTMYAFRRALAVGADMLELDVGVTKDGQVVVMHDTTLDRTTNGKGTIASHTLAQVRKLDAAYWFSGGAHAYDHGRRASAYRLRGVATGKRRPPAGFKASDFRVPTLREVLTAFPHTPINVEIKGRTKAEELSEYLTNADALARTLKGVTRKDLIVVSFKQEAVDRFHQLRPQIPVAPGIGGDADYLLSNKSPGPGVVALQVPITYELNGSLLTITTPDRVAQAHRDGYAWQVWFGDQDSDTPATWRKLISWNVDGVMTARPRAFEKVLRASGAR